MSRTAVEQAEAAYDAWRVAAAVEAKARRAWVAAWQRLTDDERLRFLRAGLTGAITHAHAVQVVSDSADAGDTRSGTTFTPQSILDAEHRDLLRRVRRG